MRMAEVRGCLPIALARAMLVVLTAHSALAFAPTILVRARVPSLSGNAAVGPGALSTFMAGSTRFRAGGVALRMSATVPSVNVGKTLEFLEGVMAPGDEAPNAKELEVIWDHIKLLHKPPLLLATSRSRGETALLRCIVPHATMQCAKRERTPAENICCWASSPPDAPMLQSHSAYLLFRSVDSLTTQLTPRFPNLLACSQLASGLLIMQGQTQMLPSDRAGLHPLVLPLCKDSQGRVTGLLKLPLKPATDLPVVRTAGKHMELLSPTLQQLIKRTAVEMAFNGAPEAGEIATAAAALGIKIEPGAKESPLGLQKFVLVKVGAFADLYEWLANDWMSKGKSEEALITCARAAALLPEWGSLHWVHSKTIMMVGGRELEARDCARAALQMPLWTVGPEIDKVIATADSSVGKMQKSYAKWAETGGPEEAFVNSGISDQQVMRASLGPFPASFSHDLVLLGLARVVLTKPLLVTCLKPALGPAWP